MNKRFFFLITVLVTCLFSGVFAEVKADCTIHYYHFLGTDEDDLTLTGDDVEFPFINWTRHDADEIIVIDDNTSERLYHLIGAIPRSIQYGDYSQPGTVKGPFLHYDVAPPLELNHPYIIEINENGSVGDRFGVEITGITCEEEEEGFVITNTSDCEGAAGNVAVPQDTEPCGDCRINGVQLAPGEGVYIEVSDTVSMGKNSKSTLDYKCVNQVIVHFYELWGTTYGGILAILALEDNPRLCRNINSKPYADGSSNQISLKLQSGRNRFKTAFADLVLDIETDTANVSSVAQNDFAVGHDSETALTVAACYEGSVTVDPNNPALSSVTLRKGQQVKVWSDRIGTITNIGQVNTAPILLLLDDGAK